MRNLILICLTLLLFSCKKTEVYSKEEVSNLEYGDTIYVKDSYEIKKYAILKNVKNRGLVEVIDIRYKYYRPTSIITYNEIQYGK